MLGANLEDFKVYEGSDELVDPWVLHKTRHLWVQGTIFFYAQKKHFLEIIKEFLISLMCFLGLLSVLVWLQPWVWFDVQPVPGAAISIVASVLFFSYFLFEVWRWNNEFIILNNFGLYHRYFDLKKLDWRNLEITWASGSEVSTPVSYKLSGVNVGSLEVMSLRGEYKTPHVTQPHALRALINLATDFKPQEDRDQDHWRY